MVLLLMLLISAVLAWPLRKPLRWQLAGEELRVGPQRVGVADGNERRRERGADMAGDRLCHERGVI